MPSTTCRAVVDTWISVVSWINCSVIVLGHPLLLPPVPLLVHCIQVVHPFHRNSVLPSRISGRGSLLGQSLKDKSGPSMVFGHGLVVLTGISLSLLSPSLTLFPSHLCFPSLIWMVVSLHCVLNPLKLTNLSVFGMGSSLSLRRRVFPSLSLLILLLFQYRQFLILCWCLPHQDFASSRLRMIPFHGSMKLGMSVQQMCLALWINTIGRKQWSSRLTLVPHPAPLTGTSFGVVMAFLRTCVSKVDVCGGFTWIIAGKPSASQSILDFWNCILTAELLGFLGLACQVFRTTADIRIQFTWLHVQRPQLPLPRHLIDIHFMTLAARQMLQPWESTGDLPTVLKVYGRQLWSGKLPSNLELRDLMQILSVATWTILDNDQYRPLVNGKQQNWQDKLRSLCLKRGVLTIHLVHPQTGGGTNTGSKGGYREQLQNALAATLLEEGHDLQWTTQAVDDILKKMGTKNLSQLMAASHSTRLQCALKALQECDIEVPKIKVTQVNKGLAKRKKTTPQPVPAHYRVLEGSLQRKWGCDCICPEFWRTNNWLSLHFG